MRKVPQVGKILWFDIVTGKGLVETYNGQFVPIEYTAFPDMVEIQTVSGQSNRRCIYFLDVFLPL